MSHIDEIVRLIEENNLSEVMLVGHSYGGMVITGVADKVFDRVKHLVYLDALVPESNTSEYDLMSPESKKHDEDNLIDGWLVAPAVPELMGVTNTEDVAWMRANLTPIPQRCFRDKFVFDSKKLTRALHSYILTSNFPSLAKCAEEAKSKGWDCYRLHGGHDAMITLPQELADILIQCYSKN